MADFCAACSVDIWGKDMGDMRGLSTPEDDLRGVGAVVICEDCGTIVVNSAGYCCSPDCLKAGKPGHGIATERAGAPDA